MIVSSSSQMTVDTEQTKYDSEDISISISPNVEDDEDINIFKWVKFNLKCVETDLKIHLPWEKFYDGKNKFFESEVFSHFKRKTVDVDIEEGMEKCPKCSSFKVLVGQVQKRSADEGMTNIFECSECKYNWEK